MTRATNQAKVIRLHVLGPVGLTDNGGTDLRSVLAQPKRLALLACLIVGPPGFRRRDSLLALLWPELDDARARAALNQAVRFLRRELGGASDSVILSRGVDELGIDPAAVWCDAVVFREQVERGEFHAALQLYRGDLLEGFFAEQGAGFQDWLDRKRDLLRSTAARAARAAAGALEKERNYTPAVAAARRAVALADADERVMRELLLLLDRLGDRAGALQAYSSFEQRLEEDFDAKPAAETLAVIERIRSRVTPAELTPSVASAHAGNGATEAPFAVPPLRQPGVPPNAMVSRSEDDVGAPNEERGPSVVRTVFRQRWWILGGALVGAAITLGVVQLLG